MKVSSERNFINDDKLLHKVVREDNEIYHMLVVPQTLIKYVLHQAHGILGHNDTAGMYWYLKWVYYWKGLWKDIGKADNKICTHSIMPNHS